MVKSPIVPAVPAEKMIPPQSLWQNLKRHPFPVVAWFDRVVALSFAFPEKLLRPLVPSGLAIDAFDGLGFVTVAMVWTKNLRPAGMPVIFGQDFFLAGYRIFTRLNDHGRRLRGLKILHSETDRRRMVWLGNLMTGYRYRHAKVEIQTRQNTTEVRTQTSDGTGIEIRFEEPGDGCELPHGSPFEDWHAARRFAGPMPFTFSPESERTFIVVEGSRQAWSPRPVRVLSWNVRLFREPPFDNTPPILANAFAVNDVEYRWEKGRVVHAGEPS